jgi:hypothetical protein
MSKPHVCPKCEGKKVPDCHPCGGKGLVWEPDTTQQLVDAIGKLLPLVPQQPVYVPIYPPAYPNPGDVPVPEPFVGPYITWGSRTTNRLEVYGNHDPLRVFDAIKVSLSQVGTQALDGSLRS